MIYYFLLFTNLRFIIKKYLLTTKKMNKIKIGAYGIGLLSLSLFLTGCGITDQLGQKAGEKIIEKTIESQTGGKVDIDTSGESMTVKGENGESITMGSAKLPDNFPTDILVFDDAKFVFSMSSKENEFSVVYLTAKKAADAFTAYKDDLVKQGWTKETEMDLGDSGKIASFAKGNRKLGVTVGTDPNGDNPDKTSVSLTGTTAGAVQN